MKKSLQFKYAIYAVAALAAISSFDAAANWQNVKDALGRGAQTFGDAMKTKVGPALGRGAQAFGRGMKNHVGPALGQGAQAFGRGMKNHVGPALGQGAQTFGRGVRNGAQSLSNKARFGALVTNDTMNRQNDRLFDRWIANDLVGLTFNNGNVLLRGRQNDALTYAYNQIKVGNRLTDVKKVVNFAARYEAQGQDLAENRTNVFRRLAHKMHHDYDISTLSTSFGQALTDELNAVVNKNAKLARGVSKVSFVPEGAKKITGRSKSGIVTAFKNDLNAIIFKDTEFNLNVNDVFAFDEHNFFGLNVALELMCKHGVSRAGMVSLIFAVSRNYNGADELMRDINVWAAHGPEKFFKKLKKEAQAALEKEAQSLEACIAKINHVKVQADDQKPAVFKTSRETELAYSRNFGSKSKFVAAMEKAGFSKEKVANVMQHGLTPAELNCLRSASIDPQYMATIEHGFIAQEVMRDIVNEKIVINEALGKAIAECKGTGLTGLAGDKRIAKFVRALVHADLDKKAVVKVLKKGLSKEVRAKLDVADKDDKVFVYNVYALQKVIAQNDGIAINVQKSAGNKKASQGSDKDSKFKVITDNVEQVKDKLKDGVALAKANPVKTAAGALALTAATGAAAVVARKAGKFNKARNKAALNDLNDSILLGGSEIDSILADLTLVSKATRKDVKNAVKSGNNVDAAVAHAKAEYEYNQKRYNKASIVGKFRFETKQLAKKQPVAVAPMVSQSVVSQPVVTQPAKAVQDPAFAHRNPFENKTMEELVNPFDMQHLGS